MRKIAVVGVGRVGLPFALTLIENGFDVEGVDVDPTLRRRVNDERVMPFHEPGFQEILETGRFEVRSRLADTRDRDAYIVTVGSPLGANLEAETGALVTVTEEIADRLRRGDLVIMRSTLAPGLGEYLRSMLEDVSGLVAGSDFMFAYCPERIVEGAAKTEITTLPQIIGAADEPSVTAARAIFEPLGPRCIAASLEEAEIAKLFCNSSRYLEFAVSNALFVMAETLGCDPQRIFALANDGYTRPVAARPGLTAGTCLRKDFGLLVEGRPEGQLFVSSWQLHESMPRFLVESTARRVGGIAGKTVGVLGLTFKRDTDDLRDSLAPKLCRLLLREGVSRLLLHDPFVPSVPELRSRRINYAEDALQLFNRCSVVFIATNHSQYAINSQHILAQARLNNVFITDIWNTLEAGAAYINNTCAPDYDDVPGSFRMGT